MTETPNTLSVARERVTKAYVDREDKLDLSGSMFAGLTEIPTEVTLIPGLRSLNITGSAISDLAPIARLSNLKELRLGKTKVEDLGPIRGLDLDVLFIPETPVRSLGALQDMRRLTHLDAEGTEVSNVAPLHHMDRLERLTLANTGVSDITPLNGCTNLRHLWLDGTKVGHIYPLETLRRLRLLSLANTRVVDLMALRSLENLETLDINQTAIEDLGPLMGLPRLSQIWMEDTQVLDLRPLLDLPLTAAGAGIWFLGTPATRASVDLAHLATMEDRESRTRDTLKFLRTLPVWPDPLPRDMKPEEDRDLTLPRLGQIFRERRLMRSETLDRVFEFTGIPAADLALMERMSTAYFENPEGVAKDYQQYARHLDLDPAWADHWFWIEALGEYKAPEEAAAAPPSDPPQQIRAPLEVGVQGNRLTRTTRASGLDPDAAARAEAGWQALRDYMDDLSAASERLGNAMPRLAAALRRLDTALSQDFGALNPVAAGIHGSRVVRLAAEAPDILMETDAADLAEFAGQITSLLARFPDWQNYQAEADPAPEAVEEALPELQEITDALEAHPDEIASDIPDALNEQIDDVTDEPQDAAARTGLARSFRNVLSALTNAALATARTIREETGDLAAQTWGAAKKTMATGISAAALDIVIAKGATLRTLAQTLPKEFGWIEPALRTLGL